MGWYRLDATGELDEHLLEDCWKLCRDLTCSGEAADQSCAIFERLSGDRRTFYFSPVIGLLAGKLGAEPCVKPSLDGLVLLHGESGAWHAHFGELQPRHVDNQSEAPFVSTFRLAL